MDNTHQYDTLVYHPFPDSSSSHRQQFDAAMSAQQAWQQPQHSPLASASAEHPRMYPLMNAPLNHVDYPSAANPAFYNYPQHNFVHHQPPIPPQHSLNLTGPPIESSIGPSRVLTRRQARAAETHSSHSRSPQRQQSAGAAISGDNRDRQFPMYFMPQSPSRTQSPDNMTTRQYQQHMNSSIPIGPSPLSMQSHSAPTPQHASASSGAYSYSYPPTHSRSASNSANSASANSGSHHRSASPALSVASAMTTVSSASASNSHTLNNASGAGVSSPATGKYPKQRKQRLFNVDRKAICQFHNEHPDMRQEDIAAKYGVERSTISKILKQKTKWLNVPENPEIRVAKHRPSKFPEIESELLKWLMDSLDSKILLTDSVIRAKAKEVSKNMQIPDDKFKASSGWVENFKQRHGIKRGVWHGEGRNVKMARALGYGPGYEPPPQDDEPRPTIADFIFKHNLYDLNVAITPLPILMQRTYPESEDEDDIVETDGNAQAGPSGASAGPQSPLHGQGSSGMHSPVHAGPPPSHAPADQQAAAGDTSMSSLSTTLSVDRPHSPASAHETADALRGSRESPSTGFPLEMMYQTAVQPTPAEDLGMPTAAEAEEAMSTVLRFVDAQSVGFVTQDEQHALRRVKHAIVQLGSGVPYDREQQE